MLLRRSRVFFWMTLCKVAIVRQFDSFFFSAIEETNTLNTCDNYKYQTMLCCICTINIISKHVKLT